MTRGSSFFSLEHFPVPPMIVEKKPALPTFHNLTVKSTDEYEHNIFPFESNAKQVTFPECPSSIFHLADVLASYIAMGPS